MVLRNARDYRRKRNPRRSNLNSQGQAGAALLKSALVYVDARQHDGSAYLQNLGTLGEVGDFKIGSVGRAEIRPGIVGGNHMRTPGTASNWASTPDSVANSITGDIDLIARVASDVWASGANPRIISKDGGAAFSAYSFGISNTGGLFFGLAPDGVAGLTFVSSSANTAFTNGQIGWIRVTWRQSDGRVQFFSAPDASTPVWVQLGIDRSIVIASIFDAPMEVDIGSSNFGLTNMYPGRIYRAQVWAGFSDAGGTLRNDFNPARANLQATSFVASTGETWTVTQTSAADTNDPTWLPFAGSKYAYIPGPAGNYGSTPDSVANSPAGDISLYGRAYANWPDGNFCNLIAKCDGAAFSYVLRKDGVGTLTCIVSQDGSTLKALASTVGVPFAANATGWVRADIDIDNGAGGVNVNFYTQPDTGSNVIPATGWVQLGTTVTVAGALANLFNSTTNVNIGSLDGNNLNWIGGIYRACMSPVVFTAPTLDFDANLSVEPHTSFVAATGETWTLNRAAAGRKLVLVDRSLFLFGTDDYMTQLLDIDTLDIAAGNATMLVTQRSYATPPGQTSYFAKRNIAGDNNGWEICTNAAENDIHCILDATTGVYDVNPAGGTSVRTGFMMMLTSILSARSAAGFNGGIGTTLTVGSDTTALDTCVNAFPVTLGCRLAGGVPNGNIDGELPAAIFVDRALSLAEVAAICLYLGVPA